MADVTLSYKGSDILELSDSGSAILKTGGKYCEDDIEVEYVKPSGGGDPYEMLLAVNNNTATNISFGDSANKIKAFMFAACTNLVSCNLENVTEIGEQSFNRSGLTGNIVITKDCRVGTSAFHSCTNISTLTFKGGLLRLQSTCFQNCSNLSILDMKFTGQLTGYMNAFTSTPNLHTLILRQNFVYPINSGFPSTCGLSSSGHIYVPSSLVDSYKSATNWSTQADKITAIEGSQYETHYADGTVIS